MGRSHLVVVARWWWVGVGTAFGGVARSTGFDFGGRFIGNVAVDRCGIGRMGVDGVALWFGGGFTARATAVVDASRAFVITPIRACGFYAFFRVNGGRAGLEIVVAT